MAGTWPKQETLATPVSPLGSRVLLAKINAIATPTSWTTPRETYSNSGRTTPAVDGVLAGYQRDIAGNAFNSSQGTAANQPIWRASGLGGFPGLDFSAGTAKQVNGGTSLFAVSAFTTGYTSYMVASCSGYPVSTSILISYEDGQNFLGVTTTTIQSATANHQTSMAHDANDLSGVYVQAWDGVTATFGINGCYKSVASAGTPPHQFTYVAGGLAGFSGFQWRNGAIGDILIYPGVHTKAQMDAISRLLAADSGLVKPFLGIVGDSQSTGLGLTSPSEMCWPNQMLKLLGLTSKQVFALNMAVSGWTLDQMIADAQVAGIGASYASSVRGDQNTVIIMGGTNSLALAGDNLSAAAAFAKLQTECALWRSASCKVIVCTCLPRDATNAGSDFEAKRLAFNALIRAAGTTLCDGISDLAANALIGAVTALGTAWYQGDNIHESEQGAAVVAELNAAAVVALWPGLAPAATAATPLAQLRDNTAPTGAFAQTFPRSIAASNLSVLTSGQLFMAAVEFKVPTLVSSISFLSGTQAAVTPTHWLFGLYDVNENLLATSADQLTTAWGASTLKTLAMATSITVPAGLYYLGIMMVAGTVISIEGVADTTALSGLAPILHGTADGSLTTALPNPAGTVTATVNYPYAYVS